MTISLTNTTIIKRKMIAKECESKIRNVAKQLKLKLYYSIIIV